MPDLQGVVFQVIDRQDRVEGIVPTELGAVKGLQWEGVQGESAQREGGQGADAQGEGEYGKDTKGEGAQGVDERGEGAQEEGTVKVVHRTEAGLEEEGTRGH